MDMDRTPSEFPRNPVEHPAGFDLGDDETSDDGDATLQKNNLERFIRDYYALPEDASEEQVAAARKKYLEKYRQ